MVRLHRAVDAGLPGQPLEQLVAEEAQLAPAGKPVGRQLLFSDQPAEVFDVYLEQLRGHGRGEDGRVLVHDSWGPTGDAA